MKGKDISENHIAPAATLNFSRRMSSEQWVNLNDCTLYQPYIDVGLKAKVVFLTFFVIVFLC